MERYKTLLAEKLKETEGRSMFTGGEVQNMLLDLWLALDTDEKTQLVTV